MYKNNFLHKKNTKKRQKTVKNGKKITNFSKQPPNRPQRSVGGVFTTLGTLDQ